MKRLANGWGFMRTLAAVLLALVTAFILLRALQVEPPAEESKTGPRYWRAPPNAPETLNEKTKDSQKDRKKRSVTGQEKDKRSGHREPKRAKP